MEEGFFPPERVKPDMCMQWVRGRPETNFLGGLKVGKDVEVRPVVTYRCTKCGHLDSYAGPPLP
jgi:hypothetical protein